MPEQLTPDSARDALRTSNGSVPKAAKVLGVGSSTLYRFLKATDVRDETKFDGGVEYRPVDGFDQYRVGSDGSIWSQQSGRWKKLTTHPDKHGYYRIKLCLDRKTHWRKVHQLVMRAFVGPCPDGMEIAHEDGVKANCALSNLRYDTHKGNHADRLRHGTSNAGERNGMSTMTEDRVRELRKRARSGEPKQELMREFSLSRRGYERILSGQRWGHVKDEVARG